MRCCICQTNLESICDAESIKGCIWNINGCEVGLCTCCEDDALEVLMASKGLILDLEGGEIQDIIQVN